MIKSKLRIAFATPCFIIGGAESYIIVKSKWLLEHGHEVIVISEGGENVKNLPFGVQHVTFNMNASPSLLSRREYNLYLEQLSNLLCSYSIDLIEAHNVSPAIHIAFCFKRTGIPFFINILSQVPYDRNPVLRKLTYNLDKLGLYYTLNSEANAYIEKKVGHKLYPTLLSIPFKGILPSKVAPQKYILSVCRLAPEKMYVKYLIEGFGKLVCGHKIASEYRLMIVGDGPLLEEFTMLSNEINTKIHKEVVVMCGTIVGEELDNLYRDCALYVGVGTTLLLGASAGKPCLLPGYTDEMRSLAWGLWGEMLIDRECLVAYAGQGRVGKTYDDFLEELLNCPAKLEKGAEMAYETYKSSYDSEVILAQWFHEYLRIIGLFSDAKKIDVLKNRLSAWRTLYWFRIVRRVYRFLKKK